MFSVWRKEKYVSIFLVTTNHRLYKNINKVLISMRNSTNEAGYETLTCSGTFGRNLCHHENLVVDEEKDPYKIAVVRSEEAERTCELVRKNAQKYQENYAKPHRVFTSSRNT